MCCASNTPQVEMKLLNNILKGGACNLVEVKILSIPAKCLETTMSKPFTD